MNEIRFSVEGPGEIVATDNGDPTNMTAFLSYKREAFNGLCLAIVRSVHGETGTIRLTAGSFSFGKATVALQSTSVTEK